MTSVGIVGGGIAGLSLTHHLAERDVSSVAFEAQAEPGGVIRSERVDGHVIEWGPQRLRESEPVRELVRATGIESSLIRAPTDIPMYVYADDELGRVPRSIGEFLRTDLLSWRGKLRLLLEPLTGEGAADETAETYFVRKFGAEAYRNVVGPLFGGIYASDPAAMPARHALSGLKRVEEQRGNLLRAALGRLREERSPPISLGEGLQQLPNALASLHADRIELETPVRTIASIDSGYHIETVDRTVEVDHVVVTAPADAAADLLEAVAPKSAGALSELTYNPLALVALEAERVERGLGYQVRRDEPLRTLGVTWNGSAFDRDGLHTAFLGGMDDPEVLELDDEELGKLAASEFETVMDASARPIAVGRLERGFPAYDESWDVLDRVDLPDCVHLLTNYTGRPGVPSRIRAARRLASELE